MYGSGTWVLIQQDVNKLSICEKKFKSQIGSLSRCHMRVIETILQLGTIRFVWRREHCKSYTK